MAEAAQRDRQVREIENLFIPLSDGTRLAARIWLPEDAEAHPVPAILEYLPYRKRDGTADRDEKNHPYVAARGYACVRVDMRGNGESDGLMLDEYLKQEQDDALEVIEWIAAQPWCTGKLGMIGISWGGFNGLQVAARKPAALKAIITLCSTDDRYADDIHYKGGALLLQNIGWAAFMLNCSAKAPDPLLVGARWREMWLHRLEHMPLLIKGWLEHNHKDGFWKHGSISEDYRQIEAAVYAVGGWSDAYSNTIPRMLEHLPGPKKGLIGPWAHRYPNLGEPGPAIGFLQECLRWWDYWLKGIDNGIMDEPPLTAYIQDSVAPRACYSERAGVWVAEPGWPSPNLSQRHWHLAPGRLCDEGEGEGESGAVMPLQSPQHTGAAAGEYCIMRLGPEFPGDQRGDDANSLCFDSAPLTEDLSILGAPLIQLELECDKPCGQVIVRLNDVDPLGQSTRVTYGVLNLRLREGSERPLEVRPGERMRIGLQLDDVGYRVPKGHRLRIALSNAYFPLLWPSPERTLMQIHLSGCAFCLPQHNGQTLAASRFAPVANSVPRPKTVLRPSMQERVVLQDVGSGRCSTQIVDDFGALRFDDHGLEVDQWSQESYSILPERPNSARAECKWRHSLRRGDWATRVESRLVVHCDQEFFYVEAEQEAFEGPRSVHRREWREKVARGVL